MAYRLQDHALDLADPPSTDALMISVDSNQMATCTHIPRQIPTEELIKLLPRAWVTNYEKLWQPQTVAQTTTEPSYKTLEDGTVEIAFDHKDTKAPPACFTTQYMMTAAETEKANSKHTINSIIRHRPNTDNMHRLLFKLDKNYTNKMPIICN